MRGPRNFFRHPDAQTTHHDIPIDDKLRTRFNRVGLKAVARRTIVPLLRAPVRTFDVEPVMNIQLPGEHSTPEPAVDIIAHEHTEASEATEGLPTSLIPFVTSAESSGIWCDSTEATSSASALQVSEPEQPPVSEDSVSRQFADVGLATVAACSTPFRQVKSIIQRVRPRRTGSINPRASVTPAVISDDCWLGWDVCQAVVKGEHVPPPMDSLIGQV